MTVMLKKIKKPFKRINRSSLRYVARAERNRANTITKRSVNARMKRINREFKKGFKLLMKHPDTVTFFGSARFTEDNRYYQQARELARRVVSDIGSTVVTGGGGGIMEAANRGATEADGKKSIGMTIRLPHEQVTNNYVTYSVDYYYFFSRKVALSFTARAYVYFPGGFGTLDEFFEILTLKQTERIDPIPIILFGSEYWGPLTRYIDKVLLNEVSTIKPQDRKLYFVTDDIDEAIRVISQPQRRRTNV